MRLRPSTTRILTVGIPALILIAAGIILTLSFRSTPQPQIEEKGPITLREKKDETQTATYIARISYPQFSTDEGIYKEFNSYVASKVTSVQNEFAKNVEDNLKQFNPQEHGLEATSSIYISYTVFQESSSIISVLFEISEYIVGMAHPSNYSMSIAYDLQKHKDLTLAELFKPGSPWLQRISTKAIHDLTAQFKEDAGALWIDEGAGPQEENFKKFALSSDELIIFFDPYQVAPYAAGMQKVTIPLKELADILL